MDNNSAVKRESYTLYSHKVNMYTQKHLNVYTLLVVYHLIFVLVHIYPSATHYGLF